MCSDHAEAAKDRVIDVLGTYGEGAVVSQAWYPGSPEIVRHQQNVVHVAVWGSHRDCARVITVRHHRK